MAHMGQSRRFCHVRRCSVCGQFRNNKLAVVYALSVCRWRWKETCWEVGLARAAAHEHWLYALCLIAWRLNGRDRVKNMGGRRLIARVRIGAATGPPA
jgi:hypothetical protein